MMWAVMGIGMIINTIKGASQVKQQQGQLNQMQQQTAQQADRLKASMSKGLDIKRGGILGGASTSIHVDYPDKAYEGLHKLQTGNLQERMGLESSMRKDFSKLKDEFFKENHYDTEFGSHGKGKVLTDDGGKPKVKNGAETTPFKSAREGFESANRLSLANKHGAQIDKFTKSEADRARSFLQQNAGQLADPAVQGELGRMIVSGKKKALKLQQEQDEERWRTEMPPTSEIQSAVEMGMKDMRGMEQRHMAAEERSRDHQDILDFEREFAAAASEERNAFRAEKKDENFLLDPRKMMELASAPPKQRFDQVLPGHMTAQLFELGIYEV